MEQKRNLEGITLVALVVTIVVLLILAGITIMYVFGENSVFKQAQDAKLKTEIAKYQEMLETAKGTIFIEGLGTFDSDKYFDYIQQQGIINNKDTDVIDNEDGTYEVTTKPGYVFEIELMPSKDNASDANIKYIGEAGKLPPTIKRIETVATKSSITAKAVVSKLGNGKVKYYYKLSTNLEDAYELISNVNENMEAIIRDGLVEGESYDIKAIVENENGRDELTVSVVTRTAITKIMLNQTELYIPLGGEERINATISPDEASTSDLMWSSTDESIASIRYTGSSALVTRSFDSDVVRFMFLLLIVI